MGCRTSFAIVSLNERIDARAANYNSSFDPDIMIASELAALYARDIARLVQEVAAFPDTPSLWKTAPGITNAAGTLALHIEGNLREYIGRQLGGISYERNRPLEFSARDVLQDELVSRLEAVQSVIPRVIGSLDAKAFDAPYPEKYNGATLTTRQFLLHLLGHLNYHLGQVDYLRRFVTGDGAIGLATL
jgi:hypothetical protein